MVGHLKIFMAMFLRSACIYKRNTRDFYVTLDEVQSEYRILGFRHSLTTIIISTFHINNLHNSAVISYFVDFKFRTRIC